MEGTGRVTDVQLSESTKTRLLAPAEAIGRQIEAVRVDSILGDDNEVYLNEITFFNDAGLPFLIRERDQELGQAWGDCLFLKSL